MEKEKLDKIKLEYELFETEEGLYSVDEVLGYIGVALKDLKYNRKNILEAMREISKDRFVAKVKNLFSVVTGDYYDVSELEQELEILDRHLELVCDFSLCNNKMVGIIDGNNSQDIYKLTQFTEKKYDYNHHYLESKRDAIGYLAGGICYRDENYEDDHKEFLEFFNEKISKLGEVKRVEKVKKM